MKSNIAIYYAGYRGKTANRYSVLNISKGNVYKLTDSKVRSLMKSGTGFENLHLMSDGSIKCDDLTHFAAGYGMGAVVIAKYGKYYLCVINESARICDMEFLSMITKWRSNSDIITTGAINVHGCNTVVDNNNAKARLLGLSRPIETFPFNDKDVAIFSNYKDTKDVKYKIPSFVNIIYNDTFNRSRIESLENLGNIQFIGESAFHLCANTPKFDEFKGIVYVGKYAFTESDIEGIIKSDTLTEIDKGGFSRTCIKGVEITSSHLRLGDEAFSGCGSLKSVKLPENTAVIPTRAFHQCIRLENFEIPKMCTRIEAEAFSGCRNLRELVIPEGVTYLAGNDCFTGCDGITELVLPKSLRAIKKCKFNMMRNLKVLKVPTEIYRKYQIVTGFDTRLELY